MQDRINDFIKVLKGNSFAVLGIFVVFAIGIASLIVPTIYSISPNEMTSDIFLSPSRNHLMGTNDVGQDIFIRIIYGAKTTMSISFVVGVVASLISSFLGIFSGLTGGICDRIIMRACDVVLAIPQTITIMLIGAYIRPDIYTLMIILILFNWCGGVKIVRAQVMKAKTRVYVSSAFTFGASRFHVLKKHILPEIFPLTLSLFIQNASRAVFMEVGLSYLGVVDASIVSWGSILKNAMNFTYLDVWKWWLVPTSAFLFLFLVSLSYTSYALEQVLNPELEEV